MSVDPVVRHRRSWLWMGLTLTGIAALIVGATMIMGIPYGTKAPRRFVQAILMGIALCSWFLFLGTLTSWRTNARPVPQAVAMLAGVVAPLAILWLLVAGLGWPAPFPTATGHPTNVGDQLRYAALRVFVSQLAAATAAGLVFGLLLGLVNGRPPLLMGLADGGSGEAEGAAADESA